jgi:uracil-DNA glycosylase
LAIAEILGEQPLADAVGKLHRAARAGVRFDVVPLPHPSGASTWTKREPGITLLRQALAAIAAHPAWRALAAVPA